MKTYKINLSGIAGFVIFLALALSGEVSWWLFAAILLMNSELSIEWTF